MLRQLEYRTEYLIQDWRPEIQNESILEVRGRKEQDNFWSLEEVPLIYIWEDLQRWQTRALRKFSLRLTPLWIVVGKLQHSSYTTKAGAHSATWQRPSRLETVSQLAGREPGCLPAPGAELPCHKVVAAQQPCTRGLTLLSVSFPAIPLLRDQTLHRVIWYKHCWGSAEEWICEQYRCKISPGLLQPV